MLPRGLANIPYQRAKALSWCIRSIISIGCDHALSRHRTVTANARRPVKGWAVDAVCCDAAEKLAGFSGRGEDRFRGGCPWPRRAVVALIHNFNLRM